MTNINFSSAIMNPYQESFTAGQVVAAANMTNVNLQAWIRRGLIVGGIDMPGKPGIRRQFSFFNVMEIAVVAALVDLGVRLEPAFKAARLFAHTSTACTGSPEREPALPFAASGRTLLCVAGNNATVAHWKPGADPLPGIRVELGKPAGFVILEIEPIFERAMTSIGVDPADILNSFDKSGESDGRRDS